MPAVLIRLYRLTGRRDDLHQAHNYLALPEDLEVSDEHLVFYHENQEVCSWGIPRTRLSEEDPPVHVRFDEDAWRLDHERLSDFLVAMLLFQASMGGMAHSGFVEEFSQEIVAPEGWRRIEIIGPAWNAYALAAEGQVLFVLRGREGEAVTVSAGARTNKLLRALEQTFGLCWDYSE